MGTGGESRQELVIWINELLQLNYTKVEQCGSGAAHCQIMDSIFRNVPLSKVKFNARQEYEYVQNFKVLQSVFDKHKIDNHIPIERLIKSKFQDNLEFLQWLKKYWDMYYPGGSYDAVARRKGTVGGEVGTPRKSSAPISSPRVSKAAPVSAARTGPVKVLVEKTAAVRIGGATRAASSTSDKRMMLDLENQNAELKVTIDQVEKEREFYFNKLREIELCVQNSADAPSVDIDQTLKDIQAIMYQTEDGFESPEDPLESF